MSDITFDGDRVVVDAAVIAQGFRVDAADVPELMRTGRMTSRSELGQDADAGRRRVTFFHQGRALRLTIDESGTIIRRSIFDV
ncbi:DUF6522 family protein [Paracoccus luteus]|uniref:DUF6522 family protein n=1 Tax=Paracoccus luteus TaxID=2508543 RepID=UPI00106FE9B0|nr:DUF6522 family protein [Paracoccus luteus]